MASTAVPRTQRLNTRGGGRTHPLPSRPDSKKIAHAIAPIMRGYDSNRIQSLESIARLAGQRPNGWTKPQFGQFEYWLAHNCGWITDNELRHDESIYKEKQNRALNTSHRFSAERFSWREQPRFETPAETKAYVPEISMTLVQDRNLTDSARRIALFALRHAYQDNRAGRFIGMTVTFIMKGLSLSRRTVQRSLTLLETRGYFRCEVAKGDSTRMCIGLIIHLLESLFPAHRKESWPEKRRNSDASTLPNKQNHFYNSIYKAKTRVSRLTWALQCMNGVARKATHCLPNQGNTAKYKGNRFKAVLPIELFPTLRTDCHAQLPT